MENVILFVVLILVLGIVLKNYKGSSTNAANANKLPSSASGRFGFQETGSEPKKDSAGRVVVKVKGGSTGIKWGVNLSHLDYLVANKLAGKVNEDEEFSKSVKVRIRPDRNSQYENSVLIETTDEKFVGWILKEASADATSVMKQIEEVLVRTAPELNGSDFTFEVSAKIEGSWSEIGEGDKEEWEADFESMEIRIVTPAEIEVD